MDRAARIAQIALNYVGCSAFDDTQKYRELILRPSDPPLQGMAYYSSPGMSTCALFVLGVWRLAGCTEPEVVDAYYPGRVGRAFSDVEAVARRFGAWVPPTDLLLPGDVFVITNEQGGDGHMGIVVGPNLQTVEGGQKDRMGYYTTIGGPFSRLIFRHGSGDLMMGGRMLYGVVRASALPIPDVNSPDVGNPAA